MGRRVAATVLAGIVGVVLVTTSAGGAVSGSAPVKTSVPAPPTAATVSPPTVPTVSTVPPVTTLWPPTVPPTSVPGTAPGTVTSPTSVAATTTFPPPPTMSVATSFDAATLLREFYSSLAIDPFDGAELVAPAVVLGGPADLFFLHEVGSAAALFANGTAPLPTYTVTADGPAVAVCRDDGVCETFADFSLDAARLVSFSLDGVPIDDRVSLYERPTVVEALRIEGAFAVRRPRDEVLSIVVFLSSEGGGTTFAWDRASYVDAGGRTFVIDPAASYVPQRLEDADVGLARIAVVGAQHGGQLVIPITTDLTGVPTEIRIPIAVR